MKVTIENDDGSSVTMTFQKGLTGLTLRRIRIKFSDGRSYLPIVDAGIPDLQPCMAIAADLARGRTPAVQVARSADVQIAAASSPIGSPLDPAKSEDLGDAGVRVLNRASRSTTGAPVDLAVTYWRLGSVAKVSTHYDVPRKVAQDWIKELRRQGNIPDQWSGRRVRPSPVKGQSNT